MFTLLASIHLFRQPKEQQMNAQNMYLSVCNMTAHIIAQYTKQFQKMPTNMERDLLYFVFFWATLNVWKTIIFCMSYPTICSLNYFPLFSRFFLSCQLTPLILIYLFFHIYCSSCSLPLSHNVRECLYSSDFRYFNLVGDVYCTPYFVTKLK